MTTEPAGSGHETHLPHKGSFSLGAVSSVLSPCRAAPWGPALGEPTKDQREPSMHHVCPFPTLWLRKLLFILCWMDSTWRTGL